MTATGLGAVPATGLGAGAWLQSALATLPRSADPEALLGPEATALVLAPHPDDESLGCGGLLAACAAAGRRAKVVVVSDGSGSHPAMPPSELVALRQAETRAAIAGLGLDPCRDLVFLGLPDRAVPAADPAAVTAILAAAPPGPLAVLTTWQHDPHADHQASFALAGAVLPHLPPGSRLFAYPVWGWAFASPVPEFPLPPPPVLEAPPRGLVFDIARHLPAKRRAVAAHASQLGGGPPGGFRLPQEALDLAFRPFELFLQAAP